MDRAVGAAEDLPARLHTMADNPAVAVGAAWSQGMDSAFEAVKSVLLSVHHDLERLVIFIAADFALGHEVSCFRLEPC
jgi:hypothetical protein